MPSFFLDPRNSAFLSIAAIAVSILLGIPAILISLWAARTSSTVARRTTEPILALQIISPAYGGHVDLRNIGPVTATGISIELIERRKRSSARLHVNEVIEKEESCTVQAWQFPFELNAEFRDQHPFGDATTDLQNIQRALRDQPRLPYPGDQMAFHLVTRPGDQRIVVSCSIPDKVRQFRIYKVGSSDSPNPVLEICSSFLVRYRAAYLRFRFAKTPSSRHCLSFRRF